MTVRNCIDTLEPRMLLAGDRLFPGDFDGDGDVDLVAIRSTAEIWIIENGTKVRSVAADQLRQSGFTVCGTGDVNGDGTDDVIVREENTAVLGAWLMRDGAPASYQPMASAFGWYPAAFADIDGDGTDDVIWLNHQSGVVGAWTMKAGQPTGWVTLGTADLRGNRLADTADLNGDGRADLIWAAGKSMGAWLVGEGGAAQYRHLGSGSDGWEFIGADALNGDAAHLYWYNAWAKQAGAWRVTATDVQYVGLGTLKLEEHRALALADVDGNGQKDIIWEWKIAHANNGVSAWLMGSGTPQSSMIEGPGPAVFNYGVYASFDLSQDPQPALVRVGEPFELKRTIAYMPTGDVYEQKSTITAPATPGPFRIAGGPERIAYDPAIPADPHFLSVEGLKTGYEGVDKIRLTTDLENRSFTPITTLGLILSANDTAGDEDDVLLRTRTDLWLPYGAHEQRLGSPILPALSGNYFVMITGISGEVLWTSPEAIPFATMAPNLTVEAVNYPADTYVAGESVHFDVVIRNNSDGPIAPGVPITVVANEKDDFGSTRYEGGLAAGDSRTVRVTATLRRYRGPVYHGSSYDYTGSFTVGLQAHLGEFTSNRPTVPVYVTSNGVVYTHSADLDGDGDDDLVYGNLSLDRLEAWILQGGVRVDTRVIATGVRLHSVGNFDGEGGDEVLVERGNAFEVYRVGTAEPISGLLPGDVPAGAVLAQVGDINGDGMDETIWTTDTLVYAAIRSPDGSFAWRELGMYQRSDNYSRGYRVHDVKDVDGDGDDDLIWAYDGLLWQSLRGHLAGAWLVGGDSIGWLDFGQANSIHLGDFNGDGKMDVLHEQDGRLELRLLQPDLTFSATPIERPADGWRLLAVADTNNDGTDDLIWQAPAHRRARSQILRNAIQTDWQLLYAPAT